MQDFGSIFSTLLPGTQAKLSPPEGQTVLDGLEVKVAFGDVWKDSLSELSGGQRYELIFKKYFSEQFIVRQPEHSHSKSVNFILFWT